MTATLPPLRPIGVDFVLIKDLAPRVGVSSAAMYQAGSRGELHLLRIGECWAVDLAEAQTWAKVYRERHAARAAAKAERAAKRAARALAQARAERDAAT